MLASQQFQARLTLFPKYFSSFPHGTCSLSDSSKHLASDGVYHQISAPVAGNTTLPARAERTPSHMSDGILTLHYTRCQGTYMCADASNVCTHHNDQRLRTYALQYGPFPVRSPLLRKSYSVYVPPLTYMLKFSG